MFLLCKSRQRNLAWRVTNKKACSRETHSPSRASKTCGHNAFQIIHIHTTVINSGLIHTTQHRTHCERDCGCNPGWCRSYPHRLRNDFKCVEWDVKPCSIQSNPRSVTNKLRLVLNAAAHLVSKNDRGLTQLHDADLHWFDLPHRVIQAWCDSTLVSAQRSHTVPDRLLGTDCCVAVSDVAGCQRLQYTPGTPSLLDVPCSQRSTLGRRAFSGTGPTI